MKNLKTRTVAAPRQLEMAFESDVIANLGSAEECGVVIALAIKVNVEKNIANIIERKT